MTPLQALPRREHPDRLTYPLLGNPCWSNVTGLEKGYISTQLLLERVISILSSFQQVKLSELIPLGGEHRLNRFFYPFVLTTLRPVALALELGFKAFYWPQLLVERVSQAFFFSESSRNEQGLTELEAQKQLGARSQELERRRGEEVTRMSCCYGMQCSTDRNELHKRNERLGGTQQLHRQGEGCFGLYRQSLVLQGTSYIKGARE